MPLQPLLHFARAATRRTLMLTGVDFYLHSDDRNVLENIIIPYFAPKPEFARVLFVGCDWYTRGYRRRFPSPHYTTLDYDPRKAKFGGPRHITDSLTNLHHHLAPQSLDLILCNGVFGWGLNAPPDVDAAFSHSAHCLRPAGVFILGWNDIPEHRPFHPDESPALRSLQPWTFPTLNTSRHLTSTPNRHTFHFYRKLPTPPI